MKRLALILLCLTFVAGCGTHQQSMTNPAGPAAAQVERLWWIVSSVLSVIFFLVIVFMMRAVHKRRTSEPFVPEPEVVDTARDRRMSRVILALVVAVVVIEFGFLATSAAQMKRERNEFVTKNAIEVEVIGHRWWWEFRYTDPIASQTVTTANELHLPTGTPVLMQMSSADVIHSFWAPNIAGKRDLIPGYKTSYRTQVDREGAWRGQCAEFCGHQHAHMAFYLIAEPMEKYRAWLQAQVQPSAEPADAQALRGRQVFLESPCVTCHTIRGTQAAAKVGPDLTHLASRSHIGAATLTNTRDNLKKWITNSQVIKPGNLMPAMKLDEQDLEALLTYLQTLK